MLDGNAVTKIAELAQAEIQLINGHQFHVSSEGAEAVHYPAHGRDTLFSLTQIVSWIATLMNESVSKPAKLMVNVVSPDMVVVMDAAEDANMNRPTLAQSDFSKVYDKFPFDTPLSQEDFIIKLQTLFADSPDRQELLKTVSNVRAEKVDSCEDDGISQVAAMRAGVVLVEKKALTNLWQLDSYRSFPEIPPPQIPYILRLHQRDSEMPKFALYPCDGGRWKVETTVAIRAWLVKSLKDAGVDLKKVVVL